MKEKLKLMESIGGIILRDSSNTICIIVKNRNIYLGYEIKVVICNKFYKGNLPFFQIILKEENPTQFMSLEIVNNTVKDYTLMVPFIPNDKANEKNGYAIITKNWKFMNEFQQLMIYSPNSNYFRKMIDEIKYLILFIIFIDIFYFIFPIYICKLPLEHNNLYCEFFRVL